MSDELELEIESIAFIARFNDDKVRQIVIKPQNRAMYLSIIDRLEDGIKVLEEPLEGVEINHKE